MSAHRQTFAGDSGLHAFATAVSGNLVQQRVESRGGAAFRASISTTEIDRTAVVETSFDALRSTTTTSADRDDGRVFLMLPRNARGDLHHRRGRESIVGGRVLVIPAGQAFEVSYSRRAHLTFIALDGRRTAGLRSGPIRSAPLSAAGQWLCTGLAPALRACATAEPGEAALVRSRAVPVLRGVVDTVLDAVARPETIHLAAQRVIAARFADPEFDLAALAAVLAVSPRTVQRGFEQAGSTFVAELRRQRIEHVARVLREQPHLRVADIAHAAGFGSASVCSAVFRAGTGLTPSQWRCADTAVVANGHPS